MSANTVGELGAVLALWTLATVGTRWAPAGVGRRLSPVLVLLGVASLLSAQYRTGYVISLVGLALLLVLRRQRALLVMLLLAAVAVLLWDPGLLTDAVPYILRGASPEQAAELNSRVDWWSAAIPVWQESPFVGAGLLTATRFEVLAPLGHGDVSTIHSTWIEALVGTGSLGTLVLAASLVAALAAAGRVVRLGLYLPVVLLVTVLVRSLTGSTFEVPGQTALVYLFLAALSVDALGSSTDDGGEHQLLHEHAETSPRTVRHG